MDSLIISIITIIIVFILSLIFNFEINWQTFLIFFLGIPLSKMFFTYKNKAKKDDKER